MARRGTSGLTKKFSLCTEVAALVGVLLSPVNSGDISSAVLLLFFPKSNISFKIGRDI